jgi:branched-subunit amino acid transport protein AzlD
MIYYYSSSNRVCLWNYKVYLYLFMCAVCVKLAPHLVSAFCLFGIVVIVSSETLPFWIGEQPSKLMCIYGKLFPVKEMNIILLTCLNVTDCFTCLCSISGFVRCIHYTPSRQYSHGHNNVP